MFDLVTQPDIGSYLMPGSPLAFSACDRLPARPAPRLGEHTDEVLAAPASAGPKKSFSGAAFGTVKVEVGSSDLHPGLIGAALTSSLVRGL